MKKQTLAEYKAQRDEIYLPLREEGIFTWDVDAEDGEEYGLATVYPVQETFIQELRWATEQLGKIFARTMQVVQQGSQELLEELGIPRNAWAAVKLRYQPDIPTLIGRFDFAHTPQGLKCLEFNSDTPGGFVEAYHVNRKVCDYFGYQDPNHGLIDDFVSAFQAARDQYQRLGYATEKIVFSSKSSIEEVALTRFLLQHSGLEAEYVPLADIYLKEEGLFAKVEDQWKPIDLWYRFYALSSMSREISPKGNPVGEWMLRAIAQKKVAVLNPPQAFLSQTKAMMALIWNLHEQGTFFTSHEHEIIDTYLLPTYLDNVLKGKHAYVRKPVLGRQGGAVTLYDREGRILSQDDEGDESFWKQTMVYQKMVELEKVETMSLTGPYQGWLIWGCYLLNGKASGVVTRLSEQITQDSCRFLPIGYR